MTPGPLAVYPPPVDVSAPSTTHSTTHSLIRPVSTLPSTVHSHSGEREELKKGVRAVAVGQSAAESHWMGLGRHECGVFALIEASAAGSGAGRYMQPSAGPI